mgnify:CR=1 FL=1
MTVMDNEDPALPETTEGEAWYDAEIAPALAAGCTIVLKPAEQTSITALKLADLVVEAGFPAGVLNVITGNGHTAGDRMVKHPDVDKIAFTGSTAVGREIMRLASGTVKQVTLELGGKGPSIVLDDADLNVAVELSVQSAFYSTGQRCTASSRLIVTDRIYPAFIEAMQKRMAAIKVGDALEAGIDIGPVASQPQLEQDLSYVEIGKAEGATLLTGGERLTMADGSIWLHPFNGAAPVREA